MCSQDISNKSNEFSKMELFELLGHPKEDGTYCEHCIEIIKTLTPEEKNRLKKSTERHLARIKENQELWLIQVQKEKQ